MKKKEYIEKYGEEAYRKILEQNKKYRQRNRDAMLKVYHENYSKNKETKLAYAKSYALTHKEEKKEYRQNNLDKQREYNHKYCSSQIGRASKLLGNYTRNDNQYNRGPCTLTREWVVDHIFSSSCVYCGDSDWKHLGCDRIDNSLPHTPENCICACGICNIDRQLQDMSVEDFKKWRSENPRECDIKKVG